MLFESICNSNQPSDLVVDREDYRRLAFVLNSCDLSLDLVSRDHSGVGHERCISELDVAPTITASYTHSRDCLKRLRIRDLEPQPLGLTLNCSTKRMFRPLLGNRCIL